MIKIERLTLPHPAPGCPSGCSLSGLAPHCSGRCTEIAQDLPVHLFDELENGQYGRDYIRQLDTQLMALFAQ